MMGTTGFSTGFCERHGVALSHAIPGLGSGLRFAGALIRWAAKQPAAIPGVNAIGPAVEQQREPCGAH